MEIGYNKTDSRYFYGAKDEMKCSYDEPSELTQGTILPGVAFLENNGVSNSRTRVIANQSHHACLLGLGLAFR